MVNKYGDFTEISVVDAPLLGRQQRPVRLYMQDGRPVTDKHGYLLKNIIGKHLAKIDIENNTFLDIKGLKLVDVMGRSSVNLRFDPTTVPGYEENGKDPAQGLDCHTQVFDINGLPLTDRNGIPLVSRTGSLYLIFGPRGDPISDLSGRDVIDKVGKVLNRHKPLKNKNDEPLFMFDSEGRPLTDSDSFPLLDITGMKMVLFDENNVPSIALTGLELCDAQGIPKGSKGCDFTKRAPLINYNAKITTENGEAAIAFDSHGYPLSDLLGNILCFNNGKCMVVHSLNKWMDYNGDVATIVPRKIYDRFSLRGFTNLSGVPIRLFDDYGRPLTDVNGIPQRHASGKLLIKFGPNGAPISDWLDRPCYDVNGYTNHSKYFRPCVPFFKKNVVDKINRFSSRGLQYFECTGMPLTNSLGYPLLNAKEEYMIMFDKGGEPLYDYRKKPVFSALGLPMVQSLDLPLIGPGGIPIRLYDKKGRPLTDSTGLPLKDVRGRYMIKLYSKCLGMFDIKGREIYDKNGTSCKFITKFNASGASNSSDKQEMIISIDGEPMHLFDEEGYPLTEQSGVVLCNRMGQSMIKCPEEGFTRTIDDKPVYDVKGRKCLKTLSKHLGLSVGLYDKNSRPLTDRHGSVLHNRKGQELVLFDKNCRPVSALVGGELYDFKGMPLQHPFADPSHIVRNPLKQVPDGIQLFDCEDLPLTDSCGYLLYTSSNVPMVYFDIHGRVKCDHSGRPVYDVRGLAVSRTSGCWKSQNGKSYRLFDSEGMPLTDEDGRELYDIEGKSLLRQDAVGRPKHTEKDSYVRDASGRRYIDIQFKPTLVPPLIKKTIQLLEEDKFPIRIYDLSGKPLTDIMGRALVNSRGEMLINVRNGLHKITDWKGKQVFDRFKMPLGCSSKTPLKTMDGKPLIFYDDKGTVLTDGKGLPLQNEDSHELMIIFDSYGRPTSTEGGAKLLDFAGRCSQHPQFGSTDELSVNKSNDYATLISAYDKKIRPVKQVETLIKH